MQRTLMFARGYLALSGLAFIVAFLASTWAGTECDAGCHAAGVLVERVLMITVVAGGLGLMYNLLNLPSHPNSPSFSPSLPPGPSALLSAITPELRS